MPKYTLYLGKKKSSDKQVNKNKQTNKIENISVQNELAAEERKWNRYHRIRKWKRLRNRLVQFLFYREVYVG